MLDYLNRNIVCLFFKFEECKRKGKLMSIGLKRIVFYFFLLIKNKLEVRVRLMILDKKG